MKTFLISLVMFIYPVLALASVFSVSGRAVNVSGEPVEFATYRIFSLLDTVKPTAYGVTDENGIFSSKLNKTGQYYVRVSAVGLSDGNKDFTITDQQPVANLGSIVCSDNTNLLGEVTVTAAKPLVSREIDRIAYDVQGDIESKTTTLDETLKKVPLVTVEPDGTIKVKGSSNFKIYKNGRPNNSFTNNAKEIFKAIPASMIKKIEVITDPGAREDAEGVGAILNIVTEQSTSIKGVLGNVGFGMDSRTLFPTPNLWASAQIDKVTLSASAGVKFITKRDEYNGGTTRTTGIYEESGNQSLSESTSTQSGNVNWWGIDGSYELDSLNLFTLEFGGYSYSVNERSSGFTSLSDAAGNLIYSYNQRGRTNPASYLDFNGNFNYQHSTHRKGEHFILSYMISTTNQRNNSTTEYSDMVNMPVDYSGIYSDYKLKFMEHTVQADWTRPFGEIHTLDVGAKYIFRDNHSRTAQRYEGTDREPFTDFTHRTSIAAAFADYRARIRRVSLRAGLRYEFSRLSAKYADGSTPGFASNLSDWVPNLAISYNVNDANTLKASYSTRINRPGISYLNPAVSETPSSTSQGNPDLGSALYHQLNLNYGLISRKVNIDLNIGYTFTNDAIIQVMDVRDDHTYSGYANAGRNREFNGSLFMQWSAGKKTSVMLNGNVSYDHFANRSLDIARGGWSGNVYARLSQKLPWKINGSLGASYWSGSTGLYSEMRPIGLSALFYHIQFTRNFLKEDRLTVRVFANNPISCRMHQRSESFNTSYKTITDTYNRPRSTFGFGVAYRFGSLNAQVKKTAATISNDDLVGRKSE